MISQIKLLNNDTVFADSPDTGDPECICSRCKHQITEHESILRVPIGQDNLKALDKHGNTLKGANLEAGFGKEFRLCEYCQQKAGLKIRK